MLGLIGLIINLIRKETLVLYPALISALGSAWLLYILKIQPGNFKLTPNLYIYVLISWLLNIFITLLTAEIGKTVLRNKEISFGQALKQTFLRFFPAVFGIFLLALVLAGLLLLSRFHKMAIFFLLPVIFINAFAVQLFPIVYVLTEQKLFSIFRVLFNFMREKFQALLNLVIFLLFLFTLTILILSLLSGLPAKITAIVDPIFQGLTNVFMIYGIIIFWQTNVSKIKVNTTA